MCKCFQARGVFNKNAVSYQTEEIIHPDHLVWSVSVGRQERLYRLKVDLFVFLSADVQRWPHRAALLLEESDRHQRDDAVAAKQTLLLGAQRQVGSTAQLHFFGVSIVKSFGFVPGTRVASPSSLNNCTNQVIFCFSGIKLFRNVLQRPRTQLWPAALCNVNVFFCNSKCELKNSCMFLSLQVNLLRWIWM